MSSPAWTPPRVRTVIIVFLAFIAANAFDCWATFRVLGADGREANPVVQSALDLGPRFFVTWKMGAAIILAGILALGSRSHRGAWRMLRVIMAAFALITIYYLFSLSVISRLAAP